MDELRLEVDPGTLRTLLGKSSTFDRRQKANIRKRIREAADESQRAVQEAAGREPVTRSANPTSRGTRARIASSVRVQILAGNRPGVKIVARAPLAQAWEARRGWRHKVYGRDVWAPQTGQPGYFSASIFANRHRTRRAVEQAMQETLKEMSSR